MTYFIQGTGPTFRSATLDEFDFQIGVEAGYTAHAATQEIKIELDTSVINVESEYSDPYYDLSVIGSNEVTLSSVDPTGTLDGNRLTKNSNGICRVKASHPFMSRLVALDMSRINFHNYKVLSEFVSGSLARNMADSMAAMASGKDATTKPIFSVQDHGNAVYVRNNNCWISILNMSAVSPWNSLGGVTRAGVAITPCHTLHARHYPVTVGTTIRFITMDNVVVDKMVESTISIDNTDISIAKLNADLPASIVPVKLMPSNESDWLPSSASWDLPILATDAQEHALTKDHYWTNTPNLVSAKNSTTWPLLTETIIAGDSGNPIFFVINNTPVVISHWSTSYQGSRYSYYLTEIAAALTTLGGGHTLSTVDLSSFTSYA